MLCCKLPVLCPKNEIKTPFCSIFEPLIKKNYKLLNNICSFPLLNIGSIYTGLLGFLGAGLSLFDIIRVIKCGSVLPCSLWRSRIKVGKIVTAEGERDFKLISSVLSLECYLLLIFGILTENRVLLLPWLILYGFIILVEFTVFIMRLFVEGFDVSKHGLLLSMVIIYNWLCVFCTFFHICMIDKAEVF